MTFKVLYKNFSLQLSQEWCVLWIEIIHKYLFLFQYSLLCFDGYFFKNFKCVYLKYFLDLFNSFCIFTNEFFFFSFFVSVFMCLFVCRGGQSIPWVGCPQVLCHFCWYVSFPWIYFSFSLPCLLSAWAVLK